MAISAECPSCRATFRVKDEAAGKRGRCPHCNERMIVPRRAPGTPSPSSADEIGLVPIDDEPKAATANDRLVPIAPEKTTESDEDASAGYVLAGGVAKKAKVVRVREGALPRTFAGAEGVKQAAAPTAKSRTPKEILAAFRGEIEPFRPSGMYILWSMIVACFMLLLPIIYVGLIGLVVYGLYYHAVYHAVLVFKAGGGANGRNLAFLIYITPLIGGAMMVAFLLKPLLARSGAQDKERELDPSVEPLLFAFIDGVCGTVGAPRPTFVRVNTEVNAAASFTGGPFSFVSREPVLIIGLGMAAGLTLKQFAGVLAHELGHMAQGTGHRLTVIIGSINLWFARVVYERDAWDQNLERWSKSGNSFAMLIGGIGRLAVWLTRRVLWVLLHVGRLISLSFIRQRENDADRYQARMVGARTVAQTCWRVREMSLASELAMTDLQASWQQRRLPDNYPKLILTNVPQIPKEMLAEFRKAMGSAKTGLFDTHPSDRDRIARAKVEEPGEGIFHLDGPATDLFCNFDSLARLLTFEFYRTQLGPAITKAQLFPVAELVEAQAVAQEGFAAADRYFLHALNYSHRLPLPWDYPQAPADAKAARTALVRARKTLHSQREAYRGSTERFHEARQRREHAEIALVLLKTGVKFKPAAFGLRAATLRAAETARDGAMADQRRLHEEFTAFPSAAAERITQALAILQADAVADRVPDGRDRREEARTLYPCVAHLGANVVPEIESVHRARVVLGGALQIYSEGKNRENAECTNAVLRASAALRDGLEEFRWKVGDTIYYPFEHARDEITLARFALPPVLPDKNDPGTLLDISADALNKLLNLYRRALGRLAVTAEEVERVLGLEPIVVPAPDENRE